MLGKQRHQPARHSSWPSHDLTLTSPASSLVPCSPFSHGNQYLGLTKTTHGIPLPNTPAWQSMANQALKRAEVLPMPHPSYTGRCPCPGHPSHSCLLAPLPTDWTCPCLRSFALTILTLARGQTNVHIVINTPV